MQGFIHHSGEYFVRNRGELQDVFFFQQSRSNNKFYISCGIDCSRLRPGLQNNNVLVPGNKPVSDDKPRLLISYGPTGRLNTVTSFFCKHEDHIEKSALKVASTLSGEVESWFRRFSTAEDLTEQYRVAEVRIDSPGSEPSPPEILRWCIYGLMLDNIGDERGQSWLQPVLSAYKSRPTKSAEDNEWIRIIESRLSRQMR